MTSREDQLAGIIQGLRLSFKEGLDMNTYINLQDRQPMTLQEYMAEEGGAPARKVTLIARTDELSNCVSLLEFLEALVTSIQRGHNTELLYESCEDIEASLYVVLVGHYRQATSLLRFSCENALLDRYFDLYPGYEQWKIGQLFVPSGVKLIKAVFPAEYEINRQLNDHISELSSFVHVNSSRVTNRMRDVLFDPRKFDTWCQLFVRSVTLITKIIVAYYSLGNTSLLDWQDFEEITETSRNDLIRETWKMRDSN